MEKLLEEAVSYFKENHGYDRMLKKMVQKYKSFERELPGSIVIENPSLAEKDAISGFMKKDYSKNKNITINLKKFQKRIDETRFAGLTIKQILETYFTNEIISNKEEKRRFNEEFELFINEIKSYCKSENTVKIIELIKQENAEMYAKIKKEYNKSSIRLKNELKIAIEAIENLSKEKISLPIFSAKITGNPHSLDRNNLAGQFLLDFLIINKRINSNKEQVKEEQIKENKRIKSTEEIAEIYYNNNLMIDEMSNMVLARNLIGYKNNKENEGWRAFYNNNEAWQITLYNLSKVDNVTSSIKKCLIVENPAVFTNIIQDEKYKKIPIVCTYGQVKLAGIILLKKLVENNVHLYYSGDIDPEGMQIADKLKTRFKDNIELVGFDEETYLNNLSNTRLDNVRLKKLKKIEDEGLVKLVKLVLDKKLASYEELNIGNLKKIIGEWLM